MRDFSFNPTYLLHAGVVAVWLLTLLVSYVCGGVDYAIRQIKKQIAAEEVRP